MVHNAGMPRAHNLARITLRCLFIVCVSQCSGRMRGEWISLAGLRVDGRRPEELRRIKCKLGCQPGADGSVMLEQVCRPLVPFLDAKS